MIRKYWDIISGAITGFFIALSVEFDTSTIQRYYSTIILMLVCIGVFKTLRQAIEKNKKVKERKHTVVDGLVDRQKPIKAINLAQEPMQNGEMFGKQIIKIWEGTKKIMNKFTKFFSKFKGYLLTILLAVLSVIELCGGFINDLCGGVLTVNGVELLPIITIVATAVVGILSNGYSKEDMQKIKEVVKATTNKDAKTTNETVKLEIKKAIKENTAKLAELNKTLTAQQKELATLNAGLASAKTTHEAKVEMCNMTPQLATEADVQMAMNEVVNNQARVADKTAEIETTQKSIESVSNMIAALKSQI